MRVRFFLNKMSVFLCFLILSTSSFSQEHSLQSELKDKGEVSGQIRNFFMNTNNRHGQSHYANAIGAVVKYESPSFYGFRAGISASTTFKAFSSDLNAPDPEYGQKSKFEQQLFDLGNRENFENIRRLEELYIRYDWKNSYVSYGKLPVKNSPLLNQSDGRMTPFAFQGLWAHHAFNGDKWTMDAAWLHKFSPRSMIEWSDWEHTFGQMGNGRQPDGTPADYRGQTDGRGVALVHLQRKDAFANVQLWNVHLDKIMNTSWFQADKNIRDFSLGVQYAFQFPMKEQERLAYENRYIQPDERGQVLSMKLGYKQNRSDAKFAYSRVFSTGRFLFPRELGRDKFYTFLPRNPIDGFGNLHIWTAEYRFAMPHLYVDVGGTTSFGAKVNDFEFNKLNLDDYYQFNTVLGYNFEGFMKGLNVEFMYVLRQNKKEHDPNIMYQDSDFHQLNLYATFSF